MGAQLISEVAKSVWAKWDRDSEGWMPLWQHMQDSAGVAGKLWDEWLPASVKDLICRGASSIDEADARTLVTWLAATHDAGKIHPLFAHQVPALADKMVSHGLPIGDFYSREQRLPHSVLSFSIIKSWLVKHHGFSIDVASRYAAIAGGHHGAPATQGLINRSDEVMGTLNGRWHAVQKELMDACAAITGADRYLSDWATRKLTPEIQMLLTAVVIVADWNASDSDLFGYGDSSRTAERVANAWRARKLPPAWHAVGNPSTILSDFAERFALPLGSEPNIMQREALRVALEMTAPGLFIIEAGMGEGKTEAALAVAEVFASKWGFGGVMIGLPTQATSDGMFTRFNPWVAKLPDAKSPEAVRSIYLAHSKSGLNEDFTAVPREASIKAVFDSDCGLEVGMSENHAVVAHQWLTGRKKGLLANFVVATVDQALFSALQSKHVVLRHLGLAGKVVIIDEVHAYDSFMNQFMQRMLYWLAKYGVPVIMLSATLPAQTRKMLVAAYEDGRPKEPATRVSRRDARSRRGESTSKSTELDGNPGYPLVIASGSSGLSIGRPEASNDGISIVLQPMEDELEALLSELQGVKDAGGCVGIICNTVDRAQAAFAALANVFGDDELILDHSRFTAPDRMAIEANIRGLLGRDDFVQASGRVRPQRLIVVGTQVLEQSLDIDFDLMITDFAPTDLLLQRLGRLHRRKAIAVPRPAHLRRPRCLIRGVDDWDSTPPKFSDGSIAVYGAWSLLRSALVLGKYLTDGKHLAVPGDIPDLVQDAYAEAIEAPDDWESALQEATVQHAQLIENKTKDAQTFLLDKPSNFAMGAAIGYLETHLGEVSEEGKSEAKGLARVRDIEESIEVILMYRRDGPRFLPHLTEFADRLVPTDTEPEYRMARALSSCTVRLPGALCRWYRIDKTLRVLEADGIAAWQKSSWLKGQLVLFLDESFQAVIDGIQLRYDERLGLQHKNLAEGES